VLQPFRWSLLMLSLLALTGCARPPGTGSLAVLVSGLLVGVEATVEVVGPDGAAIALRASAVLSDLPVGRYTVSAATVTTAATSTFVPTVTGSPVTIASGATPVVSVAYVAAPGSLQVDVVGLPVGVDADVRVEGPGGFTADLVGDTTLDDLVPGLYTLTVESVRQDDPIVGAIYLVEAAEAAVAVDSGSVAATQVSYRRRGDSGTLWIPIPKESLPDVGFVYGFDAAHLASSTDPAPDVTLETPSSSKIDGLVADGTGGLWALDSDGDRLFMFDPSDLGTDGLPSPRITITGLPSGPTAAAFDQDGGLWISLRGDDALIHFSADQLAVNGAPTPDRTLTGLLGPRGLAFDGAGNLWVANLAAGALAAYSPDQLALGGLLSPIVEIGNSSDSLDSPTGLAFDDVGNLWVANLFVDSVVRFGASQLAASGSPIPEAVLVASAGSLEGPGGLALDGSGDLWVTNSFGDSLVRFGDPASLVGKVTPEPATTIAIDGVDGGFLVFAPPADALPIALP
jgi:sugar lactone lactonase YvrE